MQKITKLCRITFMLLASEYLLGMLTALFGGDDPANRPVYAHIFFGFHVLLALVVTTYSSIYYATLKVTKPAAQLLKIASAANIATIVAFVAGVLTVSVEGVWSELSSLVMATAFLLAFVGYGYMYFLTTKPKSDSK